MPTNQWRNRIKEFRMVSSTELAKNPYNFRRHPKKQKKALQSMLAQIGIAGALIAYEHPERGLELIDGHLRKEVGGEWPTLVLDVDEAEAQALLATYDPINALASNDKAIFQELWSFLADLDIPQLVDFSSVTLPEGVFRSDPDEADEPEPEDLSQNDQPRIAGKAHHKEDVAPINRFPITLVLEADQHKRWQAFKAKHELKRDDAAFLKLLEIAEAQ